jgi:prolipoprotein diacylglyceryltransferase
MYVQGVLFILLVTWLFIRHINKQELNSTIIIIIFIIITTTRVVVVIIIPDCRQYRFVNNNK